MNKVLQWLVLLLCSTLLWARASNEVTTKTQEPSYFAFYIREIVEQSTYIWGIMSQEGKVLFANKFEHQPQFISSNRFFVAHDSAEEGEAYYQIYTLEATPKLIGEKYKEVTPFYDGVALVSRDDKPIALIDTMGRVVVEAISYKGRPVDVAGGFYDGCAYVKQGELFGFVNTKGQVHIPLKYVWVTHFNDGYALAIEEKYRQALDEEDYGKIEVQVLDVSGRVVSRLSIEQLMGNTDAISFGDEEENFSLFNRSVATGNPFVRGRKVVYDKSGAVGIISIDGKMLLKYQPRWSFADLFGDKYMRFQEGEKWGLATQDGQVLIKPTYEYLWIIGENCFFVSDAEQGSIIDKQGNSLFDYCYGIVMTLANGNFLMMANQKYHLVHPSNGELLASLSEVGVDTDAFVYNRQVDILPLLKQLNIRDSSIDGKTLDITAPEILRKFQKELWDEGRLEREIPLAKRYTQLLVDYTYHFRQNLTFDDGEVLPLHPDSLVVQIRTGDFLHYTPNKIQRQAVVKQVLDYIAKKGKVLSRSDTELVLKSPSDAYLRASVKPDAEGITLVYSYYMFDIPLPDEARSGDTVRLIY